MCEVMILNLPSEFLKLLGNSEKFKCTFKIFSLRQINIKYCVNVQNLYSQFRCYL